MDIIVNAGSSKNILENIGKHFNIEAKNNQIDIDNQNIKIKAETFFLQEGIDLTYIEGESKEELHIIRKGNQNNTIIPLTISNFSSYHKEHQENLVRNNNNTYEFAWSNTKADTFVDIPQEEKVIFITIRISVEVLHRISNKNIQPFKDILNSEEEFTFYHFCTYKILQLINQINQLKGDKDWKALMMKSLGFQLLAEFYLLISKERSKTLIGYQQLQFQRVLDIKKYILKNLEENLSLKHLSEQFFISESSIQKDFKKVFNQSPHQIIKEERLEKAKDLLQNSDYAINQIAYMLRYKSASHFTSSIKNKYGVLPKVLRQISNQF